MSDGRARGCRSRRARPRPRDRARHEGHRARSPRALPAARRGLRRPARAQHAVRARLRARRSTRPSGCCARRCPRTRRPASRSPSRPTSRSRPPTSSGSSSAIGSPSTSASASTRQRRRAARAARATPSSAARRSSQNVHVKDFAFARQDGWVGFTYCGAPMGAGLHDYPHLLETVRPARARHQRDRRALAALAGRRRDHHPNRAGMDPHHTRIPEEHDMSTTDTTETYTIAVIGAGGKMGMRVSNNLVKTAHTVCYVENSPAGQERTREAGRELTDAADCRRRRRHRRVRRARPRARRRDRRARAADEARRDRADARPGRGLRRPAHDPRRRHPGRRAPVPPVDLPAAPDARGVGRHVRRHRRPAGRDRRDRVRRPRQAGDRRGHRPRDLRARSSTCTGSRSSSSPSSSRRSSRRSRA